MRSVVLSFTALVGLGLVPALALAAPMQNGAMQPGPMQGTEVQGELPAPPQHVRTVDHPTNLTSSDTHSRISPALPQPDVGPNATATQYLHAARRAIENHRLGQAQAALENAETYLLNRSVPQGQVNQQDENPAVHNIQQALDALGNHHVQQTLSLIDETIPMAHRHEMAMRGGPMHHGMTHGPGMNEPSGQPMPQGAPPPPPRR